MPFGKTISQIAQHLIDSLGTKEAHPVSMGRDLEAANQTYAVARARQLEIFP